MASAARGPGGNRLVIGGRVASPGRGRAGPRRRAGSPSTVVSQGCRPIGQPFTVTSAERQVIRELAGRPALERLMEIVDAPRRRTSARWRRQGAPVRHRRRREAPGLRARRLPRPRGSSAPTATSGLSPSPARCRSARSCSSTSATRHGRRGSRRAPGRPRGAGALWCSRATVAAPRCSATPTTTPAIVQTCSAAPSPACSAPARSARWPDATSSTASPRRWHCFRD